MEINHVGGSSFVPSSRESDSLQLYELFPKNLTGPVSIANFERGIARFEAEYPPHSAPYAFAKGLEEGLNLSPESELPLSQASRALGSALSRFKMSQED
jgi:hypothetical protein